MQFQGKTEKLLLSVKEVCELTGLSEKNIRNLMHDNDFQVRIGRRTMIHRKKIERWLERQVKS